MSGSEMLIIGVIALLVFGKRLPEVARSLGKGIAEFRKGIQGVQDQIYGAATGQTASGAAMPVYSDDSDDYEQPTAPKFDPPPPIEATAGSGELIAERLHVSGDGAQQQATESESALPDACSP